MGRRSSSRGEPVEVVDSDALIALSSVVGALRHVLEQKEIVTEHEIDAAVRSIIQMSPMDPETKRKILFLALGPGADIEIVQH